MAPFTNSSPIQLPQTQRYGLTRREWYKNIANRIMYSRFYALLYLGMAGLSLTAIILSFLHPCPTWYFIAIDVLLNVIIVVEVVLRYTALGKLFWKSWWNVFDLAVSLLCVATLVLLCIHFRTCDATTFRENVADLALIIVRNGVQLVRMLFMLRKNKRGLFNRPAPVQFSIQSDESALLADDWDTTQDVVPSNVPANLNFDSNTLWDEEDDFV
ncbi:hypothetical protein M427DRAFT_189328 [Gonapodya prolifera JEL478]|uniref:Ion transport domain-containing protein n=1 Tax=Gonapodya prolifera (strain JEL478) TaxID=1344416 RepID=A0A139A0B4_GONPJ|nr:hypothetical protein M427DRAFT_189328 [Gonapodya prolifera JEL478]|eukprot:KXS10172.1 hypothetical protein M427DRAFT_189328 [Gonapodya prolifera JEL478]